VGSQVDSATDINAGILLLIVGETAPHDRTLQNLSILINQFYGRGFFGLPPTDLVLLY
jgi:hypothetical protein